MSARKISVRLGMATVAVSGLVLAALAPANADTVPGQNNVPGTYTLGTTVIGVGSDTSQNVVDQLMVDYNKSHSTGPRLYSWDALNPKTGLDRTAPRNPARKFSARTALRPASARWTSTRSLGTASTSASTSPARPVAASPPTRPRAPAASCSSRSPRTPRPTPPTRRLTRPLT